MFYHALFDHAVTLWSQLSSQSASLRYLCSAFFKRHRGLSQHQRRYLVNWLYTAVRYYFSLTHYLVLHAEQPSASAYLLLALVLLGEEVEESPWSEETPFHLWSFCAQHSHLPSWITFSLQTTETAFRYLCLREGTLDVRINTLRARPSEVLMALQRLGMDYHCLDSSRTAIRLLKHYSLEQTLVWQKGWCDIQSEASQYIVRQCAVKSTHCVVDLCAGAGGKALALAAVMRNQGTIYACDIHESRLAKLEERQRRLGVSNIRAVVLSEPWAVQPALRRLTAKADVVLADVPCSGSGTWRRFPELKMRMTQEHLLSLVQVQAEILEQAARLVRPGGRLVYATCSVATQENHEQISHFLKRHRHFYQHQAEQLWPMQWGDGFYYASLVREA